MISENSEQQTAHPSAAEPSKTVSSHSAPLQSAIPKRRVGTITFGLSLILIGIVSLLVLFLPHFNFTFFMKLSPALLILLGVEILCSHFFGENAKIDFWSGFLCVILVLFAMLAPLAAEGIQYLNPELYESADEVRSEIYDACNQALADQDNIADIQVSLASHFFPRKQKLTLSTLSVSNDVHIAVGFLYDFPTKEAFVQSCKNCMDRLNTLNIPFERIHFAYSNDSHEYILILDQPRQFQMNISELLLLSSETDLSAEEPTY